MVKWQIGGVNMSVRQSAMSPHDDTSIWLSIVKMHEAIYDCSYLTHDLNLNHPLYYDQWSRLSV